MPRALWRMGVAVLLLLAGCVSIAGSPEGISPSQFKFAPLVLGEAGEVGGWKAAPIVINLIRAPNDPAVVACAYSVEVPAVLNEATITDGVAQRAAARAADAAAATVAGEGLLSAQLCDRFRIQMEKELNLLIRGGRVRRADDWGRR